MRNPNSIREAAACSANADDASLWRWFSALMEDHRIRWCMTDNGWLVSVDHKHVSTEFDFDCAIRSAKRKVEEAPATSPKARSGATARRAKVRAQQPSRWVA
jgi:hypothetical protein